MIRKLADFSAAYTHEREQTLGLLQHITDESLGQRVSADGRTLGFIAWHIAVTIPEMLNRCGLELAELHATEMPGSIEQIRAAYAAASQQLLDRLQERWSDADLTVEDDMYGEKWPRAATLLALILHEVHHRGQLTVLMRQAGLVVPGVYGPAREEWAQYGLPTEP